jgi:hypothetical protein
MPLDAILREVDQLQNVSTRLEGLADQPPPMSEALLTIAGSVRDTATVLAVAGSGQRLQSDLITAHYRPGARPLEVRLSNPFDPELDNIGSLL